MKVLGKSQVILVLSFLSFACDKIDDPFPEGLGTSLDLGDGVEYIIDPELDISTGNQLLDFLNNNSWDSIQAPDNATQRFIILEEFTGHKCFNCPPGTKEVIRLSNQFPNQVIPVAIHAGTFAEPQPSGDKFRTDHRVPGGHGEDYSQEFNPDNAFPRGMVNRNGGTVSPVSAWQADVNAVINDVPDASLALRNYYDASANLLRIDLNVQWANTLPESYNLQVLITEDNVVDWQDSLGIDVEFYTHRFNLRKVVNDTWGKRLEPAVQGESQRIQYVLPLDTSWKPADVKSVAFIYNSDQNSYEIIQANSAPIE